eukprot:6213514-Pleurochrysis_carterae.AAC.1
MYLTSCLIPVPRIPTFQLPQEARSWQAPSGEKASDSEARFLALLLFARVPDSKRKEWVEVVLLEELIRRIDVYLWTTSVRGLWVLLISYPSGGGILRNFYLICKMYLLRDLQDVWFSGYFFDGTRVDRQCTSALSPASRTPAPSPTGLSIATRKALVWLLTDCSSLGRLVVARLRLDANRLKSFGGAAWELGYRRERGGKRVATILLHIIISAHAETSYTSLSLSSRLGGRTALASSVVYEVVVGSGPVRLYEWIRFPTQQKRSANF